MNDSGNRGKAAVAFSLVQTSDGKLHVFMDELALQSSRGLGDRVWRHHSFVTNFDISRDDLAAMSFPDEQLRGIGLMVVGALRAYHASDLDLPRPELP